MQICTLFRSAALHALAGRAGSSPAGGTNNFNYLEGTFSLYSFGNGGRGNKWGNEYSEAVRSVFLEFLTTGCPQSCGRESMAKSKFGAQERADMADRVIERVAALLELVAPENSSKANSLAFEIMDDLATLDEFRSRLEEKLKAGKANQDQIAALLSGKPAKRQPG